MKKGKKQQNKGLSFNEKDGRRNVLFNLLWGQGV